MKPRAPLLEPQPLCERHIHVSNDARNYDIDLITEKLMKQRSFHKDFIAGMGVESARMSIKDFIFQDTVLKDYKLFVDKKKRRIEEDEYKEIIVDNFKQSLLPKHFLNDIFDEE